MDLVQLTQPTPGRPLIIGHRGLAWNYPENTLVSFQAAIAAAADLVELDFRPTSDGILVCAHDPTVGRYLPSAAAELRSRPFSSFAWAELSQMDFGHWKAGHFDGTRLARLDQVLELFLAPSPAPRPTLLIEHKEGSPQETLALLRRYEAIDKVIVQSFDWSFLSAMHALEPRLLLAALGSQAITPERLRALQAIGARMVHWSESSLCAQELQLLHDAGLPVWAYTLNSEIGWRGALAIGLDGITTDRCDAARQVARAR